MKDIEELMQSAINFQIEIESKELQRLTYNFINYRGTQIVSFTKKTFNKLIKTSNRINDLYKLKENLNKIKF